MITVSSLFISIFLLNAPFMNHTRRFDFYKQRFPTCLDFLEIERSVHVIDDPEIELAPIFIIY